MITLEVAIIKFPDDRNNVTNDSGILLMYTLYLGINFYFLKTFSQ